MTIGIDGKDGAQVCEIVCPGHYYRYGAGENLQTGIEWCPGVERADTQEFFWGEVDADY